MKPTYTVLVCTYNRAQVLPRALDAIDQLEAPPGKSWELIVVDNASTDNTETIVKDFIARSKVSARYIREERQGHARAMNCGVAASHGEIIAHTDDDGLPERDWLLRINEAFEVHKAEIVFGPVRPKWEFRPPKWYSERFVGRFALLDYGNVPFVVANAEQAFFGVNHAVRKSLYSKQGGYREDLGPLGRTSRVGEDTEMFLRSLARGVRIVYEPTVVVYHFIPASRCRKSDIRQRVWQNGASDYLDLHFKFCDTPQLLGLPRWLFRDAVTSLLRYFNALYRRNAPDTFFYELRLRRFFTHLYHASRHGFGHNRLESTPRGLSTASQEVALSEKATLDPPCGGDGTCQGAPGDSDSQRHTVATTGPSHAIDPSGDTGPHKTVRDNPIRAGKRNERKDRFLQRLRKRIPARLLPVRTSLFNAAPPRKGDSSS
jgi:glycosyltransferase involved in cell wall biosynthesis